MENTPTILDYNNKEVLAVIKSAVAPDATPAEFAYFIQCCKSTGLNPILKEIHMIKPQGRAQVMMGYSGFLKIANSIPEYDGIEYECKEDEKGNIICGIAKVFRKDRSRPSVSISYFKEFYRGTKFNNSPWDKMPHVMIEKVAKSRAIREAFPQQFNGYYTQEEMPSEYGIENLNSAPQPEPKKFIYNLSLILDEEQKSKIREWASSNTNDGFSVVTENQMEFLISPKQILKLNEYKVNKVGDGI